MNVFVAGATGVVGSRVLPELVARGRRVTGVARSAEKAKRLREIGATAVDVDLFDADAVRQAVRGHDVVVNLATHIPPSSRAMLPGAWRMTNALRTRAAHILSDAAVAAGVGRFVQESFAPTYPDRGDRWITEDEPIAPARYNRGVAHAEAAVQRFTSAGGTGVVLRFAYFYGADSDFTKDMIAFVRKGLAPTPGRRDAYVSSISHDDAAAAVGAALDVAAGVYNVADDEPVTHEEFFASLAERLGVSPPRFLPLWTTRVFGSLGETLARSQRISNAKLKAASGWWPRYRSIREGWQVVVRELQRAGTLSA
jgi:2-alkyl-3-oxoalkanoate reductase